jgi:hypothetical protein
LCEQENLLQVCVCSYFLEGWWALLWWHSAKL